MSRIRITRAAVLFCGWVAYNAGAQAQVAIRTFENGQAPSTKHEVDTLDDTSRLTGIEIKSAGSETQSAMLNQRPLRGPQAVPELSPAATTAFTLRLIGGWRLNEPWAEGGLAIDFTTMRAWTAGHDQQNNLVEYQLPAMGSGTDFRKWPAVKKTKDFGQVYWNGITRHGQQSYTPGLAYRDGLLWVSGKEFYTSDGGNSSTIVKKFDVSGAPALKETITIPNRNMQAFGGGFIEGGPEMLIGCGGNESGQGSRDGPCWMKLDGAIINEFDPFNIGVNATAAEKAQLERIDRTMYSIGDLPWGTPPDATTGYWSTGHIHDGGLIINGVTCIWSTHGTGVLDYSKQRHGMGDGLQVLLHKYKPGQKYGDWTRFETPVGSANKSPVRGATISPDGKRVYLFVHNADLLNGYDWAPIVQCYEVR